MTIPEHIWLPIAVVVGRLHSKAIADD